MTHAELLADLDRTLAAVEAVVAGAGSDQWTAATPCAELDAHGVLNHLVRGNLLFVAIIRGEAAGGVRRAWGTGFFLRGAVRYRAGHRASPRPAEVPVPPDSPAIDRLAGWLGRPV